MTGSSYHMPNISLTQSGPVSSSRFFVWVYSGCTFSIPTPSQHHRVCENNNRVINDVFSHQTLFPENTHAINSYITSLAAYRTTTEMETGMKFSRKDRMKKANLTTRDMYKERSRYWYS